MNYSCSNKSSQTNLSLSLNLSLNLSLSLSPSLIQSVMVCLLCIILVRQMFCSPSCCCQIFFLYSLGQVCPCLPIVFVFLFSRPMFTQDCCTGPFFSFSISLFPISFRFFLIFVLLSPRPMFTPDRGSFLYFSNQIHGKTQGMVRNRKKYEKFMSCLIVLCFVTPNSY